MKCLSLLSQIDPKMRIGLQDSEREIWRPWHRKICHRYTLRERDRAVSLVSADRDCLQRQRERVLPGKAPDEVWLRFSRQQRRLSRNITVLGLITRLLQELKLEGIGAELWDTYNGKLYSKLEKDEVLNDIHVLNHSYVFFVKMEGKLYSCN